MRPRADAIVVLGCRVLSSGRLSPAARARTEAAATAYRQGVAGVVVASGGRRWGAHIEATRMKEALVEGGVPSAAVVVELCSLSTFENALFTTAALGRIGARRIGVVTSDWHLPRALANFEAMGLEAFGLPSPGPAASLVTRASRAVHERLSGWLDDARHEQRELLWRSAARLATTGTRP